MNDQQGDYLERLDGLENELGRLTRRLRGLSTHAWTTRRQPVAGCLGQLVEIAAHLEGHAAPVLPPIADHALGDAVAVVGRDALEALTRTRDAAGLDRVMAVIGAAMDASQ